MYISINPGQRHRLVKQAECAWKEISGENRRKSCSNLALAGSIITIYEWRKPQVYLISQKVKVSRNVALLQNPEFFTKKTAPDIFAKYRLAGGKLHHVTENLDRNFRLIIAEQFQEMSSVKIWLTYLERSECLRSRVWCTNYLKRSERLRRSVWIERLKNSPVDWFPRAKREASTLSLAVDSNT